MKCHSVAKCIVGNVGSSGLALHSYNTVELVMDSLKNKWSKSIQQKQRYHTFYSTHSSFSKPSTYITHNATLPLGDIPGGKFSDYMQFPQVVPAVLPNICKHTLICKMCGVSLYVQLPNHTHKTFFNFNKLKQDLSMKIYLPALLWTWEQMLIDTFGSFWFGFETEYSGVLELCVMWK